MYPLVCTGLFGFVLGVAAIGLAFAKKRGAGIGVASAALAVAVLGCCTMGGGYWQSRRQIDQALAYADPDVRPAIEAQGLSEAMNVIWFGLCTGALPLLFGAVALARAVTLPRNPGAPPAS